jgi:tetratricopeptide (TPR) repeat protein
MKPLVAAAALFLCAATAHAASIEELQEAKQHYDRGMAHYELGEFGAAVDEFKLAYARSQAPGLLFNLAQASRLNKDYGQALHFYRSYLRVRPDAPNREDVEARIAEIEPIVELQRRAEAEKLSAAGHAAAAAATVPSLRAQRSTSIVTTPPRGGRRERVAGIVVGAAGVGLLAAGVGLGVASLDAQNKLSTLAAQNGSWTPAERSLYDSGQRDAAAATALYVVGGVAVATGVILYAVGWKRDRARFAVAPTVSGGAQAVWSCAF